MLAPMTRTAAVILAVLALPAASPAELPPAAAAALQRGTEALADRLPEIAAARFREALAVDGLADPDRKRLHLLLADALVRAGEPAAALEALNDPLLEGSPEAVFWCGQALAGLGRFAEAAEVLVPLATGRDQPLHAEACLTRAALLVALGGPDAARQTLATLLDAGQPEAAQRARLELARIAFGQGDFAAARAGLGELGTPAPRLAAAAADLDARLLMEEGHPQAAATRFAELTATPDGLSREELERATLGLAAALARAGQPAAATDVLIPLIADHPDSPLLDEAFQALAALLPATPSAGDPILEQLEKWSPAPPADAAPPILVAGGGAVAAWPAGNGAAAGQLPVHALYHLAHGLQRTGDPAARARAFQLLRRLRASFPTHPLAQRALLDTGRWHLADNRLGPAQAALAALATTTADPHLEALAGFFRATGDVRAGDHQAAAAAFAAAARQLAGKAAETAAINAGVASLLAGANPALVGIPEGLPATAATELALERALVLAGRAEPAAVDQLERFIRAHPDHPRLDEARLALATAAMHADPPDLELAAAQLDQLAGRKSGAAVPAPGALAEARVRLAELQGDWDRVVAETRGFLAGHPQDPAAPDFSLRLGQALFRRGDFNEARLILEQLADAAPTAPAAEAALFLAARSAALGATSQARTESLDLYQRVIRINGTLAASARLERARTLVEMGRFDDAIAELREWMRSLDPGSRLAFTAGTLLGEAWFAKGGNDPATYEEALALYRDLATRSAPESALNHRFRFLVGLTLERLNRPGDLGQALDTYYSLLESAANQPPLDWEWPERAGFRALALLETAQRWEAAVAVATRIANLAGPSADEAAARARKLRLEHMIWEE